MIIYTLQELDKPLQIWDLCFQLVNHSLFNFCRINYLTDSSVNHFPQVFRTETQKIILKKSFTDYMIALWLFDRNWLPEFVEILEIDIEFVSKLTDDCILLLYSLTCGKLGISHLPTKRILFTKWKTDRTDSQVYIMWRHLLLRTHTFPDLRVVFSAA